MKTAIRTSVVALAAMGAMSAFAQVGDRWEPAAPTTQSTLTRAEVQAQAIEANQERHARGYVNETGLFAMPAQNATTMASRDRDEVRAEAIRASRDGLFNDERA